MLSIVIFSFNRGSFLQNCLQSVLHYAPGCTVTIVDDNSTDPQTLDTLKNLPDNVTLLQPRNSTDNRHGGLYNNMQLALERAADSEHLLFLQDDMQLVRPLTATDYQYIEQYYQQFPRAAFLNPVFLKGQRRKRDQRITRLDPDFPVYFRHYPQKKHPRGLSYADVVIAKVSRLRKANWHFSRSEIDNALTAQQHFGSMGFMLHPFAMFLPQVPVYRGKRKSFAVTLAEKRSGTEPKVFTAMTEQQLQLFLQRDPQQLPVAEQFLRCNDIKVKQPFQYSAVNAYPLLRVLHAIEQWFYQRTVDMQQYKDKKPSR